jgi:hypothetical protein
MGSPGLSFEIGLLSEGCARLDGGGVDGFASLGSPGAGLEIRLLSGPGVITDAGDGCGWASLAPLLLGESGLLASGDGVGEGASWAIERCGELRIINDEVNRLTTRIGLP